MRKSVETEYYTIEEAATVIGRGKLQASTLRNRICAGRNHPPVIRPQAGVYLFPKLSLHEWLNAMTEKAIAS